jgi:hypothetical protein
MEGYPTKRNLLLKAAQPILGIITSYFIQTGSYLENIELMNFVKFSINLATL